MRYCATHQRGYHEGAWTDLPLYTVQIAVTFAKVFACKLREIELGDCDVCEGAVISPRQDSRAHNGGWRGGSHGVRE